jgi:hypothetical protein
MSKVHGRHTVIIIDGHDISTHCNTSDLTRKADKSDLTGYGADDHEYGGGLGDGSASIGGVYDSAAGGPAAVLKPLRGSVVEMIRRPEGTGTGKPQETVDVLVEEYSESNPVADYIKWSTKLQPSGAIVDTVQ